MANGVAGWASLALENARLYTAAREADRLKDDFLAVLSHELRTPLNAIVGYSRLLRGNMLSGEKAARGLETLERNAAALTQIVEDVLDISRIVSGKIRLDVEPVELPLVVHNAVATVQPAADAKGVRLQTIIDPRRRCDLRRSRSPPPGRLEPALECRQVHAEGRARPGAGGTGRTPTSRSSSATPESGFDRSSCRSSSNDSGRRTPARPARTEASAWACRSSGTLSRCTAARSTSRVRAKAEARRSAFDCR